MALDTILVNLTESLMGAADTFNGPFYRILFPACFIGGLLLGMKGLIKAAKAAAAGHQAGQVFSAAATNFLIGVTLLALPSVMGLLLHSTFEPGQSGAITSYTGMAMTAGDGGMSEKMDSIMRAVLTLLQALGWLALVRGLMIIKKVGEGSHNHSIGVGATHIAGAVCCINIIGLAHVVQTTVGGSLFN